MKDTDVASRQDVLKNKDYESAIRNEKKKRTQK
jgi:hypothetical protein